MNVYSPALFAGRVAVVTGGTSGLGAATAAALAELGAEVHALGLDHSGSAVPDGVTTTHLDVTDGGYLVTGI